MSVSSINGEIYNSTLGPFTPNPFIILELKIFLTEEATEASQGILCPFLFDSGACDNYLNMDAFRKLCKVSNFSREWKFKKDKATLANGKKTKFDSLEKTLFVKLEDNFVFHMPFNINNGISWNIIGLANIPEYMRWVIGSREFFILRRD
jgi:hypothetical protein